MGTDDDTAHRRAVIGGSNNFWLYSSLEGFDLTHPATPTSPAVTPRVTFQTSTSAVTIDPDKSALVIIDMQNYFLSEAFDRPKGAGHKAVDQLVEHAIPAARKAGIRIVWINWGLDQKEVDEMPPAVLRAFGFVGQIDGRPLALDKHGKAKFQPEGEAGPKSNGLGTDMGLVQDPASGKKIDAGKRLMRDQWNSALYPPLDKLYEEGKDRNHKPDIWIHKNRMSAMWGPGTSCSDFLEQQGIRTLLFAGVNTDQCVGGTYQDCFSKGYDCILLNDGCGTTSPHFAQQNMAYNAANTWGFDSSCKELWDGVQTIVIEKR